jgi:hypothetical protein
VVGEVLGWCGDGTIWVARGRDYEVVKVGTYVGVRVDDIEVGGVGVVDDSGTITGWHMHNRNNGATWEVRQTTVYT